MCSSKMVAEDSEQSMKTSHSGKIRNGIMVLCCFFFLIFLLVFF